MHICDSYATQWLLFVYVRDYDFCRFYLILVLMQITIALRIKNNAKFMNNSKIKLGQGTLITTLKQD